MKHIRDSSWGEVLGKWMQWSNHPESNDSRYWYESKGAINKSDFMYVRGGMLDDLPVDEMEWTVAEIERKDISLISYMMCREWNTLEILDTLKGDKIKAIQNLDLPQEIGIVVRTSSKGSHIILDGCHRISASHMKDNLIGRQLFVGEGVIKEWAKRWA